MDMDVQELPNGVTKVALKGRIDIAAAGQAETKFSAIAGHRRAVVVDLSQVDFLASMGIRMLLLTAKTVQAKGGKMVLLGASAPIAGVLKTARIDSLIPLHDTLAAATAAVGG